MAASNSVQVKHVHVITPADPPPPCLLPLSAIDSQLFLRFTIEYLLIYTPSSALDRSTISSSFRAALSQLLVFYFPLSGRVRERPDGSGLEVVSRSQGALFLEAVSDCYSAADFDRPPRSVAEWRRFLAFSVEDVLDGSPPLVVQLTWLKDGAAAVGVGFNHCICDGIGSAEFLNSFADLAAGRLRAASELKPAPVWDRHLLNPQPQFCHRRSSSPPPEFQRVPDLCRFMSRFTDEPLVPTAVTFGKTHLTRLKSLAHSTRRPGVAAFTAFEVLAAHIWRSWARSLKLPSNQTLKLLFSINVRKRIKPNLPAGYYGNAFVLGCAQATAGELAEKKLDHAASLVKKAKERVGDEHVRHVAESVSDSRACPDSVGVLVLSQWSRLGLEKVDFGMGRPVHVGPVCSDRYCILLPVYNQTDAVKTMLAVPTSAVDKYESLVRNVAT
ncbi:fatty alcohol:caffeoyl-CoA acyltransferase [Cucurbita moschata]|uniref:Fatty alcohol:caffeoyl-CoA acyltransferase n=1 Tax=Cucurbita moschata TaxID=3662 RepID=A0A6J1FNR4_CUCMO|nr:fatty alcohol:caffeoyl-CoA acyltransferase [Cucurbita moschata]